MFEYIKLFVEWATKVAREVPERRAAQQLRAIGADLHLFVVSMNEILIHGEGLLLQIDRLKRCLLAGELETYDSALLRTTVIDQARRLEAVRQLMIFIGPELQLIDLTGYAAYRKMFVGDSPGSGSKLSWVNLWLDTMEMYGYWTITSRSKRTDESIGAVIDVVHLYEPRTSGKDAILLREHFDIENQQAILGETQVLLSQLQAKLNEHFPMEQIMLELQSRRRKGKRSESRAHQPWVPLEILGRWED